MIVYTPVEGSEGALAFTSAKGVVPTQATCLPIMVPQQNGVGAYDGHPPVGVHSLGSGQKLESGQQLSPV